MAIAVGLALCLAVVKRVLKGNAIQETPRKRRLITDNEAGMFNRLTQALPDRVVLAQVSFGALLEARDRATRNTFDRKIADFVVCDRALQVIAVIELDDSSHRGREGRDAARDMLLKKAGYRVLRYRTTPDVERVKADINGLAVDSTAVLA